MPGLHNDRSIREPRSLTVNREDRVDYRVERRR